MRRKTAVILGVSGAALALTASSAFTATGLTLGSSVPTTKVIGGTAEQAVSGATIDDVAYDFADAANTQLNKVTFTFHDAATDNATVALKVYVGSTPATWTCEAVGATTTKVSACTPPSGTTSTTGVTKIQVTVS